MQFKTPSPQVTRARFRLVASALRNVGAVAAGLAGGWMIVTLSFRWDLLAAAVVGLAAVLLSFMLVPYYAESLE